MSFLLSPICNEQQSDVNGAPLSGGLIETYLAGSSTPAPTYTDITGANPQTNPIVLNTLGLAPSPIWLDSSLIYKFIVKDATGVVQRVIDNISGISSSIPVQDQWVIYAGPPTFIDTTHFSLAGDQTSLFQIGRRVKTVNTGGLIYSSIATSVFTTLTTVGIVNDSGSLDAGLSQVSYGLLTPQNPSVPGIYAQNSFYYFTGVETFITTGTTPNYLLTETGLARFPLPLIGYVTGYRFRVKFHASSTIGAATTININGLGVINILAFDSFGNSTPPAIFAGAVLDLHYDGTQFIVVGYLYPATATTTTPGITTFATNLEVQTGSLTTKIVSPASLANAMLAGAGQSLQNVTGSRALSTNYTNSTGRPILVIFKSDSAGVQSLSALGVVGGISAYNRNVYANGPGYFVNLEFLVPNGATYQIQSNSSLNMLWLEYR